MPPPGNLDFHQEGSAFSLFPVKNNSATPLVTTGPSDFESIKESSKSLLSAVDDITITATPTPGSRSPSSSQEYSQPAGSAHEEHTNVTEANHDSDRIESAYEASAPRAPITSIETVESVGATSTQIITHTPGNSEPQIKAMPGAAAIIAKAGHNIATAVKAQVCGSGEKTKKRVSFSERTKGGPSKVDSAAQNSFGTPEHFQKPLTEGQYNDDTLVKIVIKGEETLSPDPVAGIKWRHEGTGDEELRCCYSRKMQKLEEMEKRLIAQEKMLIAHEEKMEKRLQAREKKLDRLDECLYDTVDTLEELYQVYAVDMEGRVRSAEKKYARLERRLDKINQKEKDIATMGDILDEERYDLLKEKLVANNTLVSASSEQVPAPNGIHSSFLGSPSRPSSGDSQARTAKPSPAERTSAHRSPISRSYELIKESPKFIPGLVGWTSSNPKQSSPSKNAQLPKEKISQPGQFQQQVERTVWSPTSADHSNELEVTESADANGNSGDTCTDDGAANRQLQWETEEKVYWPDEVAEE